MKILCVFGKYNYGDPNRGLGYEYANFIPAIKKLGNEVIHFDSWDRSAFNNFYELNSALLSCVNAEKPDIMFSVLMNYEIWIETLEIIKNETNTITINWATDDSWKYDSFSRYIAPYFDVYCTTYSSAYQQHLKEGHENVVLTQWAASSGSMLHPIPASACRHEASFVGTAHGNRAKTISRLQKRGISIECFGFGWKTGTISYEEILKVINESLVSINLANPNWNLRSILGKNPNQIKARTFEVPGAGGLLLTEWAEGLDEYYEPDKEILTFKNIDDLAKKVQYITNNPKERDRIATAGFLRTEKHHTYEQRMDEIFSFALDFCRQKVAGTTPETIQPDRALVDIYPKHVCSFSLKILRSILVVGFSIIWGKNRGPRAARRLIYETSWRLYGVKTYSASGLPGRMFFHETFEESISIR
jgi:spore maturation protein CgeB